MRSLVKKRDKFAFYLYVIDSSGYDFSPAINTALTGEWYNVKVDKRRKYISDVE
jgi:hypothetical protein